MYTFPHVYVCSSFEKYFSFDVLMNFCVFYIKSSIIFYLSFFFLFLSIFFFFFLILFLFTFFLFFSSFFHTPAKFCILFITFLSSFPLLFVSFLTFSFLFLFFFLLFFSLFLLFFLSFSILRLESTSYFHHSQQTFVISQSIEIAVPHKTFSFSFIGALIGLDAESPYKFDIVILFLLEF